MPNYFFLDQDYPTPKDIEKYIHSYSDGGLQEKLDWDKVVNLLAKRRAMVNALLTHSEFLFFLWKFSIENPDFMNGNFSPNLPYEPEEEYSELVTWILCSDKAFQAHIPKNFNKVRLKPIARNIVGIQLRWLKALLQTPNLPRVRSFLEQQDKYVDHPFFARIGSLD